MPSLHAVSTLSQMPSLHVVANATLCVSACSRHRQRQVALRMRMENIKQRKQITGSQHCLIFCNSNRSWRCCFVGIQELARNVASVLPSDMPELNNDIGTSDSDEDAPNQRWQPPRSRNFVPPARAPFSARPAARTDGPAVRNNNIPVNSAPSPHSTEREALARGSQVGGAPVSQQQTSHVPIPVSAPALQSAAPDTRPSGTLPWMAPELVLCGSKCTQATDVYSFGVIMYEPLTSEVPFEGFNRVQIEA
jgi:hypothetical protein